MPHASTNNEYVSLSHFISLSAKARLKFGTLTVTHEQNTHCITILCTNDRVKFPRSFSTGSIWLN
jgi:hypothetical protein